MSFATTATRKSSSRPSRSCNLCGRSGHEAPNCFRVKPCPHCNRTGHDPRRCFEVVGYPEGWSDKSPAASSNGAPPAGQGRSNNASSSSAGNNRGLIPSVSAKAHATGLIEATPVGPGLVGLAILVLLFNLVLMRIILYRQLQV
ncbi:Unknown protein [Striga hermonthica]|uniref:CCHC-type domain-containing protein n=1 Tax=Striga hermonthica TaxID=68872 RepID=A0A9N7R6B5_STRHE|nr:Unknown protein [Striga hermonthica]